LLKFYFNKQAFENLAKEFQKASWGALIISFAFGYKLNNGWAVLMGAAAYLIMQFLAFILLSELKKVS
jgi:hypothetical protein